MGKKIDKYDFKTKKLTHTVAYDTATYNNFSTFSITRTKNGLG
jgi:hypothetical protein